MAETREDEACERANVSGSEATKQEQIDFLKLVITFTEGNIRSYDTKGQISLAAFMLSANPVVQIVNTTCEASTAKTVLLVFLVSYIVTIFAYGFVLWPVVQPKHQNIASLGAQDLFYLRKPFGAAIHDYAEKLRKLSTVPELTAETLKLAYIRDVKSTRYKAALMITTTTYAIAFLDYFFVANCL